jgi:hypothetical protein
MKWILLLLLLPIFTNAQMLDAEVQKNCEKKFANFLPKKHTIIDTCMGDFNKDGKADIVLVTEEKNKPDNNRTLIILKNTGSSYNQVVKTSKAILCAGCGGIFGDPFADINLVGNVLTINHYGGSSWRWSNTYTFRFQKNEWQLIGIAEFSYHSMGCDNCDDVSMCSMTSKEINFSTKKVHEQKTKEGTCTIIVDKWKKLGKVPNITIQNFDSEKTYF